MSTSVDHAAEVLAAVLAELPISEWNDVVEKAIAFLRKERDRCDRDLEGAERSLPHKLPSSEFSFLFYMIIMLISHCSQRYVKTIFQLSSRIVAP